MNKKNFDLLVQSMREGGEILRGTREPSRQFVVENKEEVQQVRRTFHLSQDAFARFMGVSVGTLRNWEQGRRRPTGAARVLLRIAIRRPELFAEVVALLRGLCFPLFSVWCGVLALCVLCIVGLGLVGCQFGVFFLEGF